MKQTVKSRTVSARKTITPAPVIEEAVDMPVTRQSRFSWTPILYTLLLVASFFLGSLVTKTEYLQKAKDDATKLAQAQVAAPQNPNQPAPPTVINVDAGHFPLKGNKDAKVTIIEFADFRCPFCERFFTDTLPQIEKDYVETGKAKLAFRNYAFLGPASTVAANAVECAHEQNKFWEYHDYLYKNQPPESDTSMYVTDTLSTAAGTLGMDAAQFRSCLDSKKYDKNVTDDTAAGQKAGITGTPSVGINGKLIVGAQPYEQFKAAIEEALKAK